MNLESEWTELSNPVIRKTLVGGIHEPYIKIKIENQPEFYLEINLFPDVEYCNDLSGNIYFTFLIEKERNIYSCSSLDSVEIIKDKDNENEMFGIYFHSSIIWIAKIESNNYYCNLLQKS